LSSAAPVSVADWKYAEPQIPRNSFLLFFEGFLMIH
ncbi:hypothetical protein HNQ64_004247, partial [Prosthecobacter dejongeii]|nr:hypothetical protein [Prosthecobacter dejongeii]